MIYVIMGPTCSRKTKLANILMDKLNCDSINFDAFQVYKDMDIGTSKLEKSDPHYLRYHLLDIVTPDKSFSVKEYQSLARKELDSLLHRNKDVVMVGGTGLYIKATLFDYDFPDENEPIDMSDLDDKSNEELYQMLINIDPESTKTIHINNRKRILRAIAISRTNELKSERISKQEHKLIYPDVRFIYLSPNRDELYLNINNRVIEMMDNGLIDEVKNLLNKYDLSITARQGIGYKEVIDYLNQKIDYDECVALIQKRTRNYAKRQVTFFKNQFISEEYSSLEEAIKNI